MGHPRLIESLSVASFANVCHGFCCRRTLHYYWSEAEGAAAPLAGVAGWWQSPHGGAAAGTGPRVGPWATTRGTGWAADLAAPAAAERSGLAAGAEAAAPGDVPPAAILG